MKPDLSVVIPAYNEEAVIRGTLRRLATFLRTHKTQLGSTEVIVVTAGTDSTAQIARDCADDFASLQVIMPKSRVGKGRDVRLGMQAARGAVQVFMDAELPTPLPHLLPMVGELRAGSDVVIGARNLGTIHADRLRALLSVASNLLIRTTLFPSIRDTQCGFKGFTAAASKTLFADQHVRGWGFDLEVLQLAKEAGYKITQLPIPDWHETREEGLRGQGTSNAALTSLKDLIQVRSGAWVRSLARHWFITTCVGMIASFAVCLWIGLKQSVWFDEAYSIALVQQSYHKMIALTSVDAHPPLYYLALKVWTSLFGTGELALRSLSALFFAGAGVAAVWLVKRLFGRKAALVALVFTACAPFLMRYGFEIRMYSMAALIGLLGTHVLLSAVRATGRRKFWWWAGYAAMVALGMYTLYYTVFIWLAHLVWLLYLNRTSPQKTPLYKQPWLLAILGSVVLFAPWLPTFFYQLTHSALSGVSQTVTFRQLMSIVSFMVSYKVEWQLGPWESLGVVATLIVAITVVVKAWRLASAPKRAGLMLLLCYFMVPIVLLLVLSLPPSKPMFLERYVSHVVIAGYLLVGASIALLYHATRRVWVALAGVFITIMLGTGLYNLNDVGNFTFERVMQPHAKQIVADIGDCSGQTVIANDPLLYFELHYYVPASCDLRFYNNNEPIGDRGGYALLHDSPQELFNSSVIGTPTVYYVFTGEQPDYPLAGYHQVARHDIEKFHLIEYQR